MRIFIIILCMLFAATSCAQVIVPYVRTTSSGLPTDMRLRAGMNLYGPQGFGLSLYDGPDSTGMYFFNKSDSAFYGRAFKVGGSGNEWYKFLLLKPIGDDYYLGNVSGSTNTPTFNSIAAITKTDDTNVTLTLGGTPTSSVFKPVSFTLGWNGQLAVTRGGTGLSGVTTGGILYGSNTNEYSILEVDEDGYILELVDGKPKWMPKGGSTGGIVSLNGLTDSSQSFAVGNGALGFSSSGSTHTLNIPTADSSTRGLLDSADWRAFNEKLNDIAGLIVQGTNVTITGTGTIGDPYVINSSVGSVFVNSTSIIVSADSLQRAALTGDVIASQNSNATTIANGVVTYNKIQSVTAGVLLGRNPTAPGDVQEITIGSGLNLSTGGVLTATGTGGGGGGSFVSEF